eukprot:30963-Pelagococcus_subviridis.AAC.2
MPHHGQLPRLFLEPEEVVHERVDDAERQRVLLIQQHANEETRRARVLHLRELKKRRRGVQHRNRAARQDGRQHHRLSQRARPRRAQRDQYALVKRRGLERRLLQRLIQREVQAFVFRDVVSHAREQHQRVKPLRHLRVQVGREQTRGLIHRVRRPLLRGRQVQHLLPVRQRGDDLKRLRYLPRGVSLQKVAHLTVHVHHLLVHPRGDRGPGVHLVVVAAGSIPAAAAASLLLLDLIQDDVRERALLPGFRRHERRERGFVLGRHLDVALVRRRVVPPRVVVVVVVAVVALLRVVVVVAAAAAE